jgi:hypothetical protein
MDVEQLLSSLRAKRGNLCLAITSALAEIATSLPLLVMTKKKEAPRNDK